MKKVLVSLVLVSLLASVSSAQVAQVYIGSRQAGMGGCGVASATGLNAVAYNPAGILKGSRGEFLLSGGAAYQGLDQIMNSFSAVSDPAQFMVDNYATNLDANGSISGMLGFNFNHIGVSLLVPSVGVNLSKPAGTIEGSFTGMASTALVLTAGRTFTVPALPFASLDVGINAKAINVGYGGLTISGSPAPGVPINATQTVVQGSGIGFDLGARTNIAIPMVTDVSVGIALRNLAQSISYKPKTRLDTYTYTLAGPTITSSPEVEGAETTANYPTSTVIGAAATVPAIGLKVAADIESISGGTGIIPAVSDTITHIGLEYPMLMNALILRGGIASGSSVNLTTLGAKINIPFVTLEIANIIDNNNSSNTSFVVDAGIAF